MPGFKKLRFINTFLFYRWTGSEYWTTIENELGAAAAAASKSVAMTETEAGRRISIPASATMTLVKGFPGPVPRDVKIEELFAHTHTVVLCLRRPG